MTPCLGPVILFAIGVCAVAAGRMRHKVIIGMGLIHLAAGLTFVLAGWRAGGGPPLVTPESRDAASRAVASGVEAAGIHDPSAQAMAAMVILVGIGMTVLAAAICSKLAAMDGDREKGTSGEVTS